jgi:hypothetical protein
MKTFILSILFFISFFFSIFLMSHSSRAEWLQNSEFTYVNQAWIPDAFEWDFNKPGENVTYWDYSWENGIVTMWGSDDDRDYSGYPIIFIGQEPQNQYPFSNFYNYRYFLKFRVNPVQATRLTCDIPHLVIEECWAHYMVDLFFKANSTYQGVTKERMLILDLNYKWTETTWSIKHPGNPRMMSKQDGWFALAYDIPNPGWNSWKDYNLNLNDILYSVQAVSASNGVYFDVKDLKLYRVQPLIELRQYDAKFAIDRIQVEAVKIRRGGPSRNVYYMVLGDYSLEIPHVVIAIVSILIIILIVFVVFKFFARKK